ncbi:bile acid 7alpha-dehydratase [Proteocatella sphenisci]|uniref:bile acid 7alpha-dehydratase n=1 Tax=Proteocatella sphenisci TaxID=181070 RepID=UPI00048D1F9B|nr:bile acid 7alpha-dehydratase [Proteocatella sphenisci]
MTLEERIIALEKEIQNINDIEAIKELKGKYFRCLDSKHWDELESTLSPNIVTSYSDGKLVFKSPKEVTDYLRSAMPPEEISMHTGHTPEITLESENIASGRWYLEDKLIFTDGKYKGIEVNGGAFYTDKYEKVDGQWYILETGYVRIYEENFRRDEKRRILTNMHDK